MPKVHTWPYSSKPHPVGKNHKKTNMSSGEYRDGRSKYKEGK